MGISGSTRGLSMILVEADHLTAPAARNETTQRAMGGQWRRALDLDHQTRAVRATQNLRQGRTCALARNGTSARCSKRYGVGGAESLSVSEASGR